MSVEALARDKGSLPETLSPWWRNTVILIMILGFSVLIGLAVKAYQDAPPNPERIIGPLGETVFS